MARKALAVGEDEFVGDAQSLAEFVQPGGGIETHSEDELRDDSIDLEKFMNEWVEIELGHLDEDQSRNVPVGVVPNVIYLKPGVRTKVKRKFVEALYRAWSTDYDQRRNPADPTDSPLLARTKSSYQFVITEDTKEGYEWFRRLRSGAPT